MIQDGNENSEEKNLRSLNSMRAAASNCENEGSDLLSHSLYDGLDLNLVTDGFDGGDGLPFEAITEASKETNRICMDRFVRLFDEKLNRQGQEAAAENGGNSITNSAGPTSSDASSGLHLNLNGKKIQPQKEQKPIRARAASLASNVLFLHQHLGSESCWREIQDYLESGIDGGFLGGVFGGHTAGNNGVGSGDASGEGSVEIIFAEVFFFEKKVGKFRVL